MQSFQCMVRTEVSKTLKVVSWKLAGVYLHPYIIVLLCVS